MFPLLVVIVLNCLFRLLCVIVVTHKPMVCWDDANLIFGMGYSCYGLRGMSAVDFDGKKGGRPSTDFFCTAAVRLPTSLSTAPSVYRLLLHSGRPSTDFFCTAAVRLPTSFVQRPSVYRLLFFWPRKQLSTHNFKSVDIG